MLDLLMLHCSLVRLHTSLPTPKPPNKDDTQFSEIRAMDILHELSDFGWKPAGSYNCEELTRNRILKEIEDIKTALKPSQNGVKFEIDTQYVDGCFDIPSHDTDGFSICYRNVSNVIARLGKRENTDLNRVAVLLNCHYDSWPTSSAGTNPNLFEKNPRFLKQDVIFLFNGAEESSLLAAHGFITQHAWRHEIRAFINLEASGSGGRELLFQAGPANEWLLNSYLEAAVHPHCSVLGQEVFQSGVYPGDTDFRIFRDHGRIPGLDLAFVQHGYWWHTEFDEAKRIMPGSLQRAGENVFRHVEPRLGIALSNPVFRICRPEDGLFVVIYPLSLANSIGLLVILYIFGSFLWKATVEKSVYLIAVRNYVITVTVMTLVTFVMTLMSVFTYGALRWYTRHWLAVVAYGLPSLWAGLTTLALLTARVPVFQRKSFAAAIETVHLTVIAAIHFVFIYNNVASGFLFGLQLIPVLKQLLLKQTSRSIKRMGDAWKNVILTILLSLPGVAMCIYTSEMLLSIFIPIMGRTSGNPEPIVAIFVGFSAFVLVLSLAGLVASTENRRPIEEASPLNLSYVIGGVLLSTLTILYVFASLWPSPYNFADLYPTAKRTQFFHVNQAFYDRDGSLNTNETVFYAISHDFRGAEDIPFVRNDENYTMLDCHYANNPYCEVPYYFPTRHRIREKHIRVKKMAEKLKFPKKTKILQVSKKRADFDGSPALEYSFSVIGTGQISVYVIPDEDWRVINTSVARPPEKPQPHMFLYFTCSSPSNFCEWMFNIKIKKIDKIRVSEEKPLLLGVSSHYLHGPNMQSNEIKEMLEEIRVRRPHSPEWTVTATAKLPIFLRRLRNRLRFWNKRFAFMKKTVNKLRDISTSAKKYRKESETATDEIDNKMQLLASRWNELNELEEKEYERGIQALKELIVKGRGDAASAETNSYNNVKPRLETLITQMNEIKAMDKLSKSISDRTNHDHNQLAMAHKKFSEVEARNTALLKAREMMSAVPKNDVNSRFFSSTFSAFFRTPAILRSLCVQEKTNRQDVKNLESLEKKLVDFLERIQAERREKQGPQNLENGEISASNASTPPAAVDSLLVATAPRAKTKKLRSPSRSPMTSTSQSSAKSSISSALENGEISGNCPKEPPSAVDSLVSASMRKSITSDISTASTTSSK
ncbi:unnamed protein product [Caenorhabditis auriculariae]|uniref:FXNA-like protease n=1 Tax=Caenorhabditis auriculariae TaxID=2777116 RepID=A0A8S1HJ66_9PELO|nr:unnamed protein product [Caenorhabditis auriculariae]